MPRTNMGRVKRPKTPYDDAIALLEGAKQRSGATNEALSARMLASSATVARRFQAPETMRLGELCELCALLGLELTITAQYPDEIDITK